MQFKAQVRLCFTQADLIAYRVGQMFDTKSGKTIMPWDYYPELFSAEKETYESRLQEQEMENYKERRKIAMQKYNQNRKEVSEWEKRH